MIWSLPLLALFGHADHHVQKTPSLIEGNFNALLRGR
jgi:hypothetical protein